MLEKERKKEKQIEIKRVREMKKREIEKKREKKKKEKQIEIKRVREMKKRER